MNSKDLAGPAFLAGMNGLPAGAPALDLSAKMRILLADLALLVKAALSVGRGGLPAKTSLLPLLAVATFLVGGCAHVAMPEKDLAGRLGYQPSEIERKWRLEPFWWKAYGDDRLDALVELALKRNPDVASAVISAARAAVQAGLTERDQWPTLSGGGSASVRLNLSESAPSTRSFGTNLNLSWELDLWRRTAAAAASADLERLASAGDLEAAKQSLANKVVDAYFNLAYLHDALAESERSLQSLISVRGIVNLKYQSGLAAAVEPLQSDQSVIQARDSVLNARYQLESGQNALRELLNYPPGEDPPLELITLTGAIIPRPDLDVPLAVLANRPDLKSAELRLEKAFLGAKSASMSWLPAISLSSALSAGGSSLGMAMANPSGSLGLSMALPFLDWSRISKNIRLSELEFESVKLSFESALVAALNEIDLARRHLEMVEEQLANAKKRHELAEGVAAHYRERYQAGAAELSDLISAVNSANSARLSVLSATLQLISTGNLVYKAMSGRYVALAPEEAGGHQSALNSGSGGSSEPSAENLPVDPANAAEGQAARR